MDIRPKKFCFKCYVKRVKRKTKKYLRKFFPDAECLKPKCRSKYGVK